MSNNNDNGTTIAMAHSEAPVFEAEGKRLVLFRVGSDWGCKARDLGRLLGYADDGKKLVGKVGGDWSDEFVEGVDFLNNVSQVTEVVTSRRPPARPELILTREGIHLVCLKTRQPLGRQIRRWLASEVMIQIADTGSYGQPAAPSLPAPTPALTLPAELTAALTTVATMQSQFGTAMATMQTQIGAAMTALAESLATTRRESREATDALMDMQAATERRVDALERSATSQGAAMLDAYKELLGSAEEVVARSNARIDALERRVTSAPTPSLPMELSPDDVRAHLPALAPSFCRADLGRRLWGSSDWRSAWITPALDALVATGELREYEGRTRAGASQVRYEVVTNEAKAPAPMPASSAPTRHEEDERVRRMVEQKREAGRKGWIAKAAKTKQDQAALGEPKPRKPSERKMPRIPGLDPDPAVAYLLYRATYLQSPWKRSDLMYAVAHFIKVAQMDEILDRLLADGRLVCIDRGYGRPRLIGYRPALYRVAANEAAA